MDAADTASPVSTPEAAAGQENPAAALPAEPSDDKPSEAPDGAQSSDKEGDSEGEDGVVSQPANALGDSGAAMQWPIAAENPNPVHPCTGLPLADDPAYAESALVQALQGATSAEDDQDHDAGEQKHSDAPRHAKWLHGRLESVQHLMKKVERRIAEILREVRG